MSEELRASGGFVAPADVFRYMMMPGDVFYLTFQVQGRFRRWRLRRQGWSTEWTVEYEYRTVRDALPAFTAKRGVVS